jgi:carbohydrate-selective porin OprB
MESSLKKLDQGLTQALTLVSGPAIRNRYSRGEEVVVSTHLEVYYRFHVMEHLAITPDFQWIFSPTLNPDTNNLTYLGIRGRATF